MTTKEIAVSEKRTERTIRRLIHKTEDQEIIKKLEDSWITKKQPDFTEEEVKKIIGSKKKRDIKIRERISILKININIISMELEDIKKEIEKLDIQEFEKEKK